MNNRVSVIILLQVFLGFSLYATELKNQIGVWGGMRFPISSADSNGIGYGINGYYPLNQNLLVGASIGILPYKSDASRILSLNNINYSLLPVLVEAKYLIENFYIGGGLGVAFATGEMSGYGASLSAIGGYAYPINESLSLDFGIRMYFIKDSKSEPYTNFIPNIGIVYCF